MPQQNVYKIINQNQLTQSSINIFIYRHQLKNVTKELKKEIVHNKKTYNFNTLIKYIIFIKIGSVILIIVIIK